MIVVYSTIYGGYDRPKPPRPYPAVFEWRLYTDDPEIYAPGWRVVVEPREGHPRMRAKWRKCHPPEDVDRSLYLDASIRLRDPALIEHVCCLLETGNVWCMYPHPERTTISEEMRASVVMPKYHGLEQAMRDQLAHYSTFVKGLGLWAGGILARRHTPTVLRAGSDWYAQCLRWTYQDQISLPFVLAHHDIKPTALPGCLWQNPHFSVEPHRSDL